MNIISKNERKEGPIEGAAVWRGVGTPFVGLGSGKQASLTNVFLGKNHSRKLHTG